MQTKATQPNKTVDEYMKMPYVTVIQEDQSDGNVCYMALNPELPGCMAQGATTQAAFDNLTEARRQLLAVLLKRGVTIPEPSGQRQAALLEIMLGAATPEKRRNRRHAARSMRRRA